MSRRWMTTIVALAVALGFFFAVATMSLRGDFDSRPTIVASVDAASGSAASIASADYGRKQAAVHLALVRHAPIVPFIRTLEQGARGETVKQLQRALVRARVRPARARASGVFGAPLAVEIRAFQIRTHIKPLTGIYGPKTHHQLQPYYDLAGRRALQALAHARTQQGHFNAIAHAAAVAWKHRTSMAYSQSFTRAFLPALPDFPRATDCSGYATWLFKVAHLPDPSGFDYRIVGYTGTLAQHGTRISALAHLHVGDLVFYGGGYPYGHVAIVVVAGFTSLVSSHGSPGIKVVSFRYRPVSAVRRYF